MKTTQNGKVNLLSNTPDKVLSNKHKATKQNKR